MGDQSSPPDQKKVFKKKIPKIPLHKFFHTKNLKISPRKISGYKFLSTQLSKKAFDHLNSVPQKILASNSTFTFQAQEIPSKLNKSEEKTCKKSNLHLWYEKIRRYLHSHVSNPNKISSHQYLFHLSLNTKKLFNC